MVSRLNFSNIYIQNLPLKPASRVFSQGLFDLPLYTFPSAVGDFTWGMSERVGFFPAKIATTTLHFGLACRLRL